MFPLIMPVNIFSDQEYVFEREMYYYLGVYQQSEDKLSDDVDLEATTEGEGPEHEMPEEEDHIKRTGRRLFPPFSARLLRDHWYSHHNTGPNMETINSVQ